MSKELQFTETRWGERRPKKMAPPASPGAPAVLRGFIDAIRPFIAERYATGADLGTREDDIIAACQLVGLTHPLQPALKTERGAALARRRLGRAPGREGSPHTRRRAARGRSQSGISASR